LLYFTDSVEEVMQIIRTRVIEVFGFKLVRRRPSRILLEPSSLA
jgi:hypothetical protein